NENKMDDGQRPHSIGDGTDIYTDTGSKNLLLTVGDNIVLTLEEACEEIDGVPVECTQFVEIEGKVYFDQKFIDGYTSKGLQASDVFVLASDAAFCARFAVNGETVTTFEDLADNETVLFSSLPFDKGYSYLNYRCYLGGGWHGNIGLVFTSANLDDLNQSAIQPDMICTGNPSQDASNLYPLTYSNRRTYRGMTWAISMDGDTRKLDTDGTYLPVYEIIDGESVIDFYSWGIADASLLPGGSTFDHDFIVANANGGTNTCPELAAAMSVEERSVFANNLGNFFCFNEIQSGASGLAFDPTNGDKGQYIESPTVDDARTHLDERRFDKDQNGTYENDDNFGFYGRCPYDPTTPPYFIHTVTGNLTVTGPSNGDFSSEILDALQVISSPDGDCEILSASKDDPNGTKYTLPVSCNVYDAGTLQGTTLVATSKDITYSVTDRDSSSEFAFTCGGQVMTGINEDKSTFDISCNMTVDFVAIDDFGGTFDKSQTQIIEFDVVSGFVSIPPQGNDSSMKADNVGDYDYSLALGTKTKQSCGSVQTGCFKSELSNNKIYYVPSGDAEVISVNYILTVTSADGFGKTSEATLTFSFVDFGEVTPPIVEVPPTTSVHEGYVKDLTSIVMGSVKAGSYDGSLAISSISPSNSNLSLVDGSIYFSAPDVDTNSDSVFTVAITDDGGAGDTVYTDFTITTVPRKVFTITFDSRDITAIPIGSSAYESQGCKDDPATNVKKHYCILTADDDDEWNGSISISADNGAKKACPESYNVAVTEDITISITLVNSGNTCP
ncbi:MAG TPA: hypothetical protein VLA24_08700, partial [Pseudomonadales bacterium]|nr:hypothetical protein [Pseudomonadales bacterium]